MAEFVVKLADERGRVQQHVEHGYSEAEVRDRFAQQGYLVYWVKPQGVLTGGNLKTIESLAGSRSDIHTTGKILFVEDTGEYPYSVDRMFWNLQRTGKLSGLKGLIVGGFKLKTDDAGEEFGKTLQEIVLEKVKDYSYPVCFEFPVGHQKYNVALKCGVPHQLLVKPMECSLTETK